MGTNPRIRPRRLAEKLRYIRLSLGLTQRAPVKRLGVEDLTTHGKISEFEAGTREPSLLVLLQYARAANVYLDALVDDELDLPAKLPAAKKSEGVRRSRR